MLGNLLENKFTGPVILIVAGILILAVPNIIQWIIGVILIVWGVLKLVQSNTK